MEIPQLPTDNLYKFAALLGFILAFLPMAYITVRSDVLGANVAEAEARSSHLNSWLDGQLSLESPTASQDDVRRMREASQQIAVITARAGAEVDALRTLINYLMWVSFVGIALCGWGFHQWYHRVQKHQDAILAAEARKPYVG